jgi:hypothetical protein
MISPHDATFTNREETGGKMDDFPRSNPPQIQLHHLAPKVELLVSQELMMMSKAFAFFEDKASSFHPHPVTSIVIPILPMLDVT